MADAKQVTLTWQGRELVFQGEAPGKAPIVVDGRTAEGPSPMEALLLAMAGCTASDVVVVMQKKKVDLQRLTGPARERCTLWWQRMSFNQHLDRLDGLAPLIREPALQMLQRCQLKLGRTLLVVSGWRSVQEQMLNYQKGRVFIRETVDWEIADKTLVVTNSKPGGSAHNVITLKGKRASMALDVIPLLPNGQPEWTVSMDFWDALYEIAWKVGLDPLGDLTGAYLNGDLGHFEEPG